MKKITLALTVILLLASIACAEDAGLQAMDYESLLDLKQAVDMELYTRPESEPRVLAVGEYVVGEDIEAGQYYLTMNTYEFNKPAFSEIYIYESKEAYLSSGNSVWHDLITINEESPSVELKDGELVSVQDSPITISARELTESQRCVYPIPEGTYVPCGVYKVGTDIPAGSYQVYMGSLNGGDILLYADYEHYTAGDHETRIELHAHWSDHVNAMMIQEGNIIYVLKDVVLQKQKALVFE